jgi:hypothetical protein
VVNFKLWLLYPQEETLGPIASLDIIEDKNLFLVLGFEHLVCLARRLAAMLLHYTGSVLL